MAGRSHRRVGAIVAAAGQSLRMGAIDKIFTPLAGRPLIWHVLHIFQECVVVDNIVLVLSEDNLAKGEALVQREAFRKVTAVCLGGERRQDSVSAGLSRMKACKWIIVHDGARPCITPLLIEQGLEAARETGAAIAAVPSKDTVKIVDAGGSVVHTPPRSNVWIAQTPQIFRFDIIEQAYRNSRQDATDEAMLVEALGHKVKVFMGSYENLKVTTPEDVVLAEEILERRNASGRRV